MAQTKRKRQRKHRGTQAGTVEARGRTGRRPTTSEVKKTAARDRRDHRLDTPPTWRGSFNRAAISALIFGVFGVIALGLNIPSAIVLTAVMVLVYLPLSYTTDRFFYNRRQRKKAAGGGR